MGEGKAINMGLTGTEQEKQDYLKKAIEIIERPLSPSDIKERDGGGGRKLRYISGGKVISILNEAFGYMWDFEVVEEKLIPSLPKFNKYNKTAEDQPPYIQVLGRLTIPFLGIVKEQFGTKILLGGATEQEGATKSAGTDAMKKCASLLGIGAELYEDIDPVEDTKPTYQKKTYTKPPQPKPTPAPTPPAAPQVNPWEAVKEETEMLKKYKERLGVEENEKLDVYVQEYKSDLAATWKDVQPDNIKEFNKFLEKKIIELSQ